MITTFEDWIKQIIGANELCSDYQEKVSKALSNKQLMDIVLDANGVSYLCQMQSKGFALPYEVITRRFGSFINGKYVSEHKNEKGNGYTSKIYCCHRGEIEGNTTLLTLLGCDCMVNVKENHILTVYSDKNTQLSVKCPSSSRVIVHYWGEEPKYEGNVELVKEK